MYYALLALPVVALAIWRVRKRQVRTARLRDCARERGLRFNRADILDLAARYADTVLLQVGHSRRAWNTLCGMRDRRAWVGFLAQCDLGQGADRLRLQRCMAVLEVPTGIEAVLLPVSSDEEHGFVRTPLGFLGFLPAPAYSPAADPSHALFVRRPSLGDDPRTKRLAMAIRRYPREWTWEAGESLLLVASPHRSESREDRILGAMLDAVADVAANVFAADARRVAPDTPT